MLTIAESDTRFLVVPEDAAEVDSLPAEDVYKRQAQLSAGVILVDFHEQPFEVCNPLLIPVSYTHLSIC